MACETQIWRCVHLHLHLDVHLCTSTLRCIDSQMTTWSQLEIWKCTSYVQEKEKQDSDTHKHLVVCKTNLQEQFYQSSSILYIRESIIYEKSFKGKTI